MKENWNFPVELQPIKNSMGYRLMRTDTNQKLSFVSKLYDVITHKQAMDILERQLKESGIKIREKKIQMWGKYESSLNAQYILDNKIVIVRENFAGMLILKNGYDKQTRFVVALGVYRQVCSNGMMAYQEEFEYSVRHIGEALVGLAEFLKKRDLLGSILMKDFSRMKQVAPVIENIMFTKKEYNEYLQLGLFERYKKEIGNNLYAEYQAHTDFISHHLIPNKAVKYNTLVTPKFIELIQ